MGGRRLLALAVFCRSWSRRLPNNVIGTGATPRPGYGLPTAAADPRQIQ